MSEKPIIYKHHRFPPEIIAQETVAPLSGSGLFVIDEKDTLQITNFSNVLFAQIQFVVLN